VRARKFDETMFCAHRDRLVSSWYGQILQHVSTDGSSGCSYRDRLRDRMMEAQVAAITIDSEARGGTWIRAIALDYYSAWRTTDVREMAATMNQTTRRARP
jgi:hypothetical protein